MNADRLTERQQELKAAHGTPKQFAKAVRAAAGQLLITNDEADEAIRKYNDKWARACLTKYSSGNGI